MRVIKPKPCVICGSVFQPTGNCHKFCPACKPAHLRETARNNGYAWQVKMGRIKNPGVGTGHAQKHGADNPTFKPDAPHRYKDHKKACCERCGSTRFLCWHHKDRDRGNNAPSNIETVCKRCHQIEHGCADNLPTEVSSWTRMKLSAHGTKLSKTLRRRKDGTYISPKEHA